MYRQGSISQVDSLRKIVHAKHNLLNKNTDVQETEIESKRIPRYKALMRVLKGGLSRFFRFCSKSPRKNIGIMVKITM
jgi:hypothetical protein